MATRCFWPPERRLPRGPTFRSRRQVVFPWENFGNMWENHEKTMRKTWENHGKTVETWLGLSSEIEDCSNYFKMYLPLKYIYIYVYIYIYILESEIQRTSKSPLRVVMFGRSPQTIVVDNTYTYWYPNIYWVIIKNSPSHLNPGRDFTPQWSSPGCRSCTRSPNCLGSTPLGLTMSRDMSSWWFMCFQPVRNSKTK